MDIPYLPVFRLFSGLLSIPILQVFVLLYKERILFLVWEWNCSLFLVYNSLMIAVDHRKTLACWKNGAVKYYFFLFSVLFKMCLKGQWMNLQGSNDTLWSFLFLQNSTAEFFRYLLSYVINMYLRCRVSIANNKQRSR